MTAGRPSADVRAVLEPGEELRWCETAPGRGAYRIAGVVWVVAVVGAGLAGCFAGAWFLFALDATETAAVAFLAGLLGGVVGGALVAAAVAASLAAWRIVGGMEYAGTDRRLIARGGLLRRSCESIPWEDVEYVDLRYYHGVPREVVVYDRHGTTGRLLSPSRGDVRIRDVPRLHDVFARIQAAREDRAGSVGVGSAVGSGSTELPSPIEAALAPGETVLHAADEPVWRRPARRRQRDVAAFALAGALALGTVAAAWLGLARVAAGPPVIPVVPFVVGLLVDAVALAAYVRRRGDARVEPVLTDRRLLTHDGEAVHESLRWSETAGLALEGSRIVVLEEARGVEAIPVRAVWGEFKRPRMLVPAGEDAAPLYRQLRSLGGGSEAEVRQPSGVASPTLD